MRKIVMLLAVALLTGACQTKESRQNEYLSFLYEYMPLPDRTDYPRSFYEEQVTLALQARAEMPWGEKVPEREFRHFVLPIRVNNETLDSSRAMFYRELKPRLEGLSMEQAILEVNHWCHEHVTYRPTDARTSSPLATIRTAYGRCGEESTLLVAALRAVAIPARQVYTPRWARTDNPKYYIHFTLSHLVDGQPQLLTYPEEATWQSDFARGVQLEPGDYLLTTGTRMASGKVLASMQHFTLSSDTTLTFTLRENKEEVQVIGSQNAENRYFDLQEQAEKTLLSTTGRGYYVLALVAPNHEPTNHALRDIAAYREEFEQWGRKLVVLLQDKGTARRFNFSEFSQLPSTVVWGTDIDQKILNEICAELRLSSTSLPVFLICDTFNRVVFCQQGYTINLGEQLLKVIHQL